MRIVEINNVQFCANFKKDNKGYFAKLAAKENPLKKTSILLDKFKQAYPQHELEILERVKFLDKTAYKISNNTNGKMLDIVVEHNDEELNSVLRTLNKEIEINGNFFDCNV